MTTDTLSLDIDDFYVDGSDEFWHRDAPTKLKDLYDDDDDYEQKLRALTSTINDLQEQMYAHNRYGMLVVFQAMDAAGKDSTIQHVFSGVNPLGLRVCSYKRPSDKELDHDFMWRNFLDMPERGTIGIFNRSYYEEVLVVKVHPEILTNSQRLPEEITDNLDKLWENRYKDIRHMETYLHRNGYRVIKFFLNVSQKEQGKRLLKRIEDPAKNWKFDDQDVIERGFWKKYMNAYEEAINATATNKAPWYVIPADDKKNMRLIVAQALVHEMKKMKFRYPESNTRQKKTLDELAKVIREQDEDE